MLSDRDAQMAVDGAEQQTRGHDREGKQGGDRPEALEQAGANGMSGHEASDGPENADPEHGDAKARAEPRSRPRQAIVIDHRPVSKPGRRTLRAMPWRHCRSA